MFPSSFTGDGNLSRNSWGAVRGLSSLCRFKGCCIPRLFFRCCKTPEVLLAATQRHAALQAALTWPKHSLSSEQVSHFSLPPDTVSNVGCCAQQSGTTRAIQPHICRVTSWLALMPTMGTFSLALLLVPLMQRLCRQQECKQNDQVMGPAFIYLQLLMEGGQNALWPQSKRLIDCHYWRLSVNRVVTKKWFQCYYTNLGTHFPARQPGSLKQKEFCCCGTW